MSKHRKGDIEKAIKHAARAGWPERKIAKRCGVRVDEVRRVLEKSTK